MKKYFLIFMITLTSLPVHAVWLSTTAKVEHITTYATTETVLVTLSKDGADITECSNKTAFAISKDLSSEARSRMYSMLLSAQTTGRDVVVSYNDVGNCEPWGSNANAYRKIVRMW